MKVLVVSHSHLGLYGAITSLKYLLRNIDWQFDMVYPKHYRENATDEEIRAYTNYRVGKIYRSYLPNRNSAVSRIPTCKRLIKDLLIGVAAFFDSFQLKKIIRDGSYDYVLLNSLILYPMIHRKPHYVLYDREKYNGNRFLRRQLFRKLNMADKVIFIDPALIPPLKEMRTEYRVINNPFDMSEMKDMNPDEIKAKFPEIHTEKIVILIAGAVTEPKGVSFAIEAFQHLNRNGLQLLIAGNGQKDYVEKCKQLAKDSDVVFLGDQEHIQEIYLLTDYLLRADLFFATGRTVYEGLFAGCGVIIQSDDPSDREKMQEYETYKDKIYFYKTRDVSSLTDVFESLPSAKMTERTFRSNVDQYIASVKDFLE